MNRRVAVRGIVMYDGKFLAVRLNNYENGMQTGGAKDYWCTTGGGVDPGESLLPALQREVIEELGVEPVIGKLLYVQQFLHSGREHLEFFFHLTNSEDFLNIDLSLTSHGSLEIAELDFIDPQTPNLWPVFLQHEDIADHIANYTGPRFFDYLSA